MPLTPEEKARRARDRMIETSKQYQTSTYCRKFVAPVFQKMIRAEFAAMPAGKEPAIVDGNLALVDRNVGQVVCVTCGKVCRWNDHKTVNTGHFLAGRSNSILFVEANVAPQCTRCNLHLSGNQNNYRRWMIEVRGEDVVDQLEKLKLMSVPFLREELVEWRIMFSERLKVAENLMAER